MSKLMKINISGIRSYGVKKEDAQQIQFHSPLTLFLGQNGCGKTTIIEALKFACSGELPGGTKMGQGFVADPYMHQAVMVLGQIQLRILDMRGNKATIMRVIKSERVANKGLKFSTVDSTLRYIKSNGEKDEISGRIADLNMMCSQLMGVPHAILNNVIFCHQEQSLWPLDEASTFKKKFDEIFDNVKYNKCVDEFRNIFKKKTNALKVLKAELITKKVLKDEAEDKRMRLQGRRKKLTEIEREIEKNQEILLPIVKRLDEISSLENELMDLQKLLSGKENEMKNLKNQEKRFLENMKEESQLSDEELRAEIASFHGDKEVKEKKLKVLCDRRESLLDEESDVDTKIQRKNAIMVQTREECKVLNNLVKQRKDGVINLATKLSFELDKDNFEVDNAIANIKKLVEDKKDDLKKLGESFKRAEDDFQANINKTTETVISLENEIKLNKEKIDNDTTEIENIREKIDTLSISDENLLAYRLQIENIEKEIKNLNETVNEAVITKTIFTNDENIRRNNRFLDELEAENILHNKNNVVENEMRNINTDINGKVNDIKKIKANFSQEFSILFDVVPETNIKRKVDEIRSKSDNLFKEGTNKINKLEMQLETRKVDKQHKVDSLHNFRAELKEAESKILAACGADSYEEKCNNLRLEIIDLQRNKGEQSSAKALYERFVNDIETKKCCPVCTTKIENQKKTSVVYDLRQEISKIPKKLARTIEMLDKSENEYKELLQLKQDNEKIGVWKAKIEKLVEEIENISKVIDGINVDVKQCKENIKIPQQSMEMSTKISASAALLDQRQTDVSKLRTKLEMCESQLKKIPSNRTQRDTDAELSKTKSLIVSLQQEKDELQSKLNKKNTRLNQLREERNELVEAELNLQKLMHEKPQLLEYMRKCEENVKKCEEEIAKKKIILDEKRATLSDLKETLEDTKITNTIDLNESRDRLSELNNAFNDIVKWHKEAKIYESKELDKKFQAVLDEATALQNLKLELKEQQNNMNDLISEMKVEIANSAHTFRNLKDNENLRQTRRDCASISTELEKLQKQIGNYNYMTVRKEKQTLVSKQDAGNQNITHLNGQKTQLHDALQELEEDLNRPNLKNAAVEYRNKLIEVDINESALKNIKMCANALDNSICMFHRTRMMAINRNIRELWREIYKGNDIDYIEIDSGDIKTVGSKRVYNYCVMQRKNDTMMEMRGRCSAGQKVLACLIIRIALADILSSNCGILALDEPTTNLDRQNIISLSKSLAKLVESRRNQANFQLVVITHDEEFLSALRQVDCVREYYEVTRNMYGNTVIKSESL